MIWRITTAILSMAVMGTAVGLASAVDPQPAPDQQWKLGVRIGSHPGGGLRVHQVFEESPAEAIGLRAGMVILAVDGVQYDDPRAARDKILYQTGDAIDIVYFDGMGCYRVTAQLTTREVVVPAVKPGEPPVRKVVPQAVNIKRVEVSDPRKK